MCCYIHEGTKTIAVIVFTSPNDVILKCAACSFDMCKEVHIFCVQGCSDTALIVSVHFQLLAVFFFFFFFFLHHSTREMGV
jgi:hypothetical protein